MEKYILKRVNARYSKWEITKDKYEQKKQELTPEDFEKAYEIRYSNDGYGPTYYEKSLEHTPEELHLLMAYDRLIAQEKSEKHLKTIKGCVIFFTVLMAISIIVSIIFGVQLADALQF